MRTSLIAMVLVLLHMWGSAAAAAQGAKRLALLIGNQAYASDVGPLKNPANDIGVVGVALAQVGFDLGTPLRDGTREQILSAVYDYADRLKAAGPGAIGFLYYSGHGAAIGGDNMIIPVNVRGASPRELEIAGLKLAEITSILEGQAPQAAHLVVFDACRNNLGGSRGAKGFVPMAERPGMLVAFSTAPGATASDEGGESGPYAAALAAEIVRPGLNHDDLFFEVRRRVAEATHEEQVPWTQDGLLQQVHMGPQAGATRMDGAAGEEAAQVWAVTKDSTSRAVLEAFIARYKDTFFAELARGRLRQLETKPAAPKTALAPAAPAVVGGTPRNDHAFDGEWTITSTNTTCTVKRWINVYVVSQGTISGGTQISGKMSASGEGTWKMQDRRYSGHIDYSGKFSGDKGSGKFVKPGSHCYGEFTAHRN